MKNRKFGLAVSTLILAAQLGSSLAAAEPSLEQLSRIETYLENNDIEGLRAYVEQNPELLEGDSQLANLLDEFMRESTDLPSFLGYSLEGGADPGVGGIAPGAGDTAPAGDAAY